MFPRNEFIRGLFCLCLCLLGAAAWARPLSVLLLPGDPSTRTAVSAVRQLQLDPALAQVRFHVLPSTRLGPGELELMARADAALVYNMGRDLAASIAPAVQAMTARGARAYAVGAPFEEGERQAGLTRDEELRAYAQAGGSDNYAAMVKRLLARDFGLPLSYPEAVPYPARGLWNPRSNQLFASFDAYAADYLARRPEGRGRVWVGVLFNRVTAQAGSSALLEAIMNALEARGFNVVPAFGYPSEIPAEQYFIDSRGQARVAAVVALALKMGNVPEKTVPAMKRLDVPLVNAISLFNQTRQQWEDSPLGLGLAERAWQVAGAEFAGAIAPTVVASKEQLVDPVTGLAYMSEAPIPERIERLADRIKKWVALRYELNTNKRVAVIYYNYPPGKENIGASYLNVLPRSLWQILSRLEQAGYNAQGRPATEEALFDALREHGANIGNWAPGALEKMVRSGHAMLLPVSDYRKWFDRQPEKLRRAMVQAWGEPENSRGMLWKDGKGKPHFVFPAQRYGNLVFAPQPSRGWEGDVKKMYHDVALPPHHQYLAFYLWLQKGYQAHAMVHVGTHATHEWLSGKEVGFTAADPGEAMVGDVPQLYPYIVDDIGEALQAKRRGMATIISHMTPPFDRASLNLELVKLRGLIDDYVVAAQKSESAAAAALGEINAQGRKLGVLKDIGKDTLANGEEVEELEHYLKEVSEHQAPYGLHTFGVAPPREMQRSTAEAILTLAGKLAPAEYQRRLETLMANMEACGKAELDALEAGLAGRYVAAGPGNDPIRNPDSLPTGRNLYGFDPSRLPTPGTWEQGRSLAEKFVVDYRQRHGQYPDRVVFNLWSTEAMRHEGVTEAEILALLGVKPQWDERGRVSGLEIIPRRDLGRPRVDVTVVPSGLYRDALPTLMLLVDEAVSKVKDLEEDDNPIRANVLKTRQALEQRGIAPAEAARLAAVRVFTEPSGAYGTGVDNVVQAANTWDKESQVADVYFNRVGHLFGQGYWGDRPGGAALAVDIFKMALKDAKAAIHSRSSNLYGTLDNDDVFQYLGATAMAIRQVNGKSPETLVLNLADGKGGKHETLDKFMGREMRTRYTNPEWVKAMLNEGYAGARFVMKVTEHLWGWQVTVPEAVDGAKWQEMYETYVADRNQLGVRDKFREAKNLRAYQAVVDKMLVAINKGYWQAEPRVKAHLEQVNREVIAEAGVACNANSCSSAEVTALAQAQDARDMAEARSLPAPGSGARAPGRSSTLPAAASKAAQVAQVAPPPGAKAAAQPAQAKAAPPPAPAPASPAPAGEPVEGFEVQEQQSLSRPMPPALRNWAMAGFLALVLLGVILRARRRARLA
ncbi:cobaltochelatase subunit CobN [Azovibrio restrictus]|uniref:cobaltochelatase subunit CobN n=1 Tax=Azovibrio restrictus TaxID=146938 RepID=UPI0026F13AC0|nr:cobaltochelatase subunit CobN [Azovibrio restrictus]MDD3481455.1 cobaltochelatase subunit CobN [Azovibrio restrictus]